MSEKARRNGWVALIAVAVAVLVWRLFFSGGTDGDLNSPNADRRLIAMESLWRQDTDSARAKLREMTDDPDPRVVLQSIRGMGANRDEKNRLYLESIAHAAEQKPEYRREALASLGNYESAPVSHFATVLKSERDPQVRAGAAQALARRKDKSTIPAMYQALSDPDPDVRIWAITGIKNITFKGFSYDATMPPEQQREVLKQIGEFLKRNSYM